MSHTLPKGTKILCPRKRHLVGTLCREIKPGEPISATSLNFEEGQERIVGERSECKLCGSVYFIQNRLYTEDGWQPSDPQLEPVTRR